MSGRITETCIGIPIEPLYYEVLLKFKKQNVRYNYTVSRCPATPPELQKFVKDTKIMFVWARDLVA
ncbi:hypothetical protein BCV72DRAFT_126966, partial [Rhizopus microsporus var. microsporus]